MNVKLVPMDKGHLPAILALENECFQSPWSENIFESELENNSVSMIVAENSYGAVLGYGALSVVLDEGTLEKIAVAPSARKLGVATEILSAFLRFGAANLAFITLEVRAGNSPAIALYTGLGFLEVGRRKNYYADLNEDAILMTKEF
ncbi:MAG: ribosomal protein S18-alanine N-acetyltransferase [Oscillospiraceae bacterium]